MDINVKNTLDITINVGAKFPKPLPDAMLNAYAQVAAWCNEHGATIEDKGDYYEVVAIPAPTLDELRAAKLTALESSFDAHVHGSFQCSQGYPMQFDRSDTIAVEGAIQLLRATGQDKGYLTDALDVSHYDVPIETMEQVKVEMLGAYATCHAKKQEYRAAIAAAQDKAALDAIVFTWE